MAGNSPYALQNIGRGGIAGLETYAASKKELRDLDKEIVNAKLSMETARREGDWKKYNAQAKQLEVLINMRNADLDRDTKVKVANIQAGATDRQNSQIKLTTALSTINNEIGRTTRNEDGTLKVLTPDQKQHLAALRQQAWIIATQLYGEAQAKLMYGGASGLDTPDGVESQIKVIGSKPK